MFKRWFSRSETYLGNFAFLSLDMHSHLVPGIDDGSQSVEQSLLYIEAMKKMGWRGIITTPHIFSDLYPNNKQTIQTPFDAVKTQLDPDFYFRFAAEYMVDETFEALLNGDQILTFGNNHVLIEMSYLGESPRIRDMVFQLKIKGYQPVLAHPERYIFYHRNYDAYTTLKDMGCLFQLNILSVTGYYGPEVRKIALRLLADKMYDLAGTDLHHDRHLQALQTLTTAKILHDLSMYNFINASLINTVT